MARDGIRPPILGLESAAVRLGRGGSAIVPRIPKSWNPPHQVTFQKTFRFYARDTNGKYQLDVEELRNVFLRSQEVAEKIREFRFNRIAKIIADDVPTTLPSKSRMILHLLPMATFGSRSNVDLRSWRMELGMFVGLIGGFSHHRFNADGFVAWTEVAYAQVFRNGCLEITSVCASSGPKSAAELLPSVGFEQQIFRKTKHAKDLLQSLSVECPIVVMASFTGIKGWRMGLSPAYVTSPVDVFDREPLLLPEIVIETFNDSSVAEMRPIVDAVWNAAGWPGSPHYDDNGNWDGNR